MVSPALLFGGASIAIPVSIYVAVGLRRKPRFRATARVLGATHVATGWLSPGKIVGDGFTIVAVARPAGRSRRFRTTVRATVPDVPGRYHLGARFFTDFPNWKHARIRERGSQRVFFVDVSIPQWTEPSGEQRDRLTDWLGRASVDPSLWERTFAEARIRDITIYDGAVETSFSGIVSDPVRLGRTVDLLKGLAR